MEIHFKKGIPGFEYIKNLEISNLKDNENFKMMTSKYDINFVVVNPFEVYSDYEIDLDNETIKDLEINKSDEVLVLNILTIGKSIDQITVNLKAPIVINVSNKLGAQMILQNNIYTTKHPLINKENNNVGDY